MQFIIDTIGILGFLIALYTFVKTQLVKSSIEIVAGPNFSIYYTSDGGTGIYIPIAYINDSDRSGKVLTTSLHLFPPNKAARFTMRWADFVTHDAKAKGYNHLDHSRAFSVPSQTVIDKFIWFVWRQNNGQPPLEFTAGQYKMEIEIQISKSEKKTFIHMFTLSAEDISALDLEKQFKSNGTRTVTFENYPRENIFDSFPPRSS